MPTHTDALAQVYARSLYELAEQAGGRDKITEIGQELEEICELVRGDRACREFLASPIIERDRREESLRRIFSDRVTDLTLRFMLVLNAKGRLKHLQTIADAYDQLVQETFGRVEVDLYTAAPLGEDQIESIRTRIRQSLGKDPVLYTYTDESMLGGLRLRIGDQLIDGSVAGRLRRMRHELRGGRHSDGRVGDFFEENGP